MTRCPSCSSEIESATRFCPECGQPLESVTSLPTRAAERGAPQALPNATAPVSTDPGLTGRFAPGTMLNDRYRIVALLGRGGMGEVYRAEDLKLGQPVALKFLPREVEAAADRLERLLGEVRTALRVTHPNVCRVYDIGEVEGRHFLSMEYVDGEDLASLLRRIGRLPQDKANEIARQLCAGLAAAHDLGILHRDLKPANIMLDGRGRVRITDFGLAGTVEEIEGAEIAAGTPGYMAPEQLAGTAVTIRSDLYGLGLVLYELYTGKRAFEAATLDELRRLHEESAPASPRSLVEGLDPAVEGIVLRCLESEPSRRPASALEVAGALPGGDPLAAALAAGETPSPEMVAAAGHADALHPAVAVGAAVFALAVFAFGAWANGRILMTAYLSLDRPPAVVEDRAREIVRELGYTDPVDANPVDTFVGYGFNNARIADIQRNDLSADRWDRLRGRAELVVLAYRQRPAVMIPNPREFGTFIGAVVNLRNPFPDVNGDAEVIMDADGRLRSFFYRGPRVSPDPAPEAEPDWSKAFELAELDIAAFRRVEPRRHHFVAPAQRAAWVGTVSWDPGVEIRIEAGATRGRLVVFETLSSAAALEQATQPAETSTGPPWTYIVFNTVVLAIVLMAVALAQRNMRRGRADRRGAAVVASTTFTLTILWETTRAHGLFTTTGFPRMFPILGLAFFYLIVIWSLYTAFEPYGRRIWPTIFISWNRLVGVSQRRFADPLVGRSILVGVAVGSVLTLVPALRYMLRTWLEGAPPRPGVNPNQMLLGAPAISSVLGDANTAIAEGLTVALVLVAGRYMFRRRWAAVAFAVIVLVVLDQPSSLVDVVAPVVSALGLIAVLLGGGLVALFAAKLAVNFGFIAMASDWSAWHARTTILTMIVIAALAAYGAWSATSGWDWGEEET